MTLHDKHVRDWYIMQQHSSLVDAEVAAENDWLTTTKTSILKEKINRFNKLLAKLIRRSSP